ncbi:mothers against decapentaplegic homolog 1-like [Aphidius gifuensis]|uniref:mothers against decapentaplegic homolog 1-like n=1 Tax=Aphidius gifuensis TaxID=684658 RepID=UPI001CDD2685|nr:mothers against decapentaplegic homolog 1-like [Aphidius gifuensis]
MNKINEQVKEIDVSLLNTTIELSALIDNLSRFKTPNEWASITYYEKNNSIGTFTSNENIIIVDGSTGPSLRSRFCIGYFGDKLNKQQEFKKARSLIRAGVKFFYDGNDVFVTNNSATDLFVHPLGLNKYNNRTDNTVYRVISKKTFLIFNKSIFQRQLLDHLQESDEAAGELYNSCIIRMSFTNGWGFKRSINDITAIPCWLEIKLHIPIGILESVLGPSIKPPALGHRKYASINPSNCHKSHYYY